MVTDGNCIYLAEQAVNLLNRSWAFFMPIQNHFRKVTKMIIHIKDIVEVATCCAKSTAAFPKT